MHVNPSGGRRCGGRRTLLNEVASTEPFALWAVSRCALVRDVLLLVKAVDDADINGVIEVNLRRAVSPWAAWSRVWAAAVLGPFGNMGCLRPYQQANVNCRLDWSLVIATDPARRIAELLPWNVTL